MSSCTSLVCTDSACSESAKAALRDTTIFSWLGRIWSAFTILPPPTPLEDVPRTAERIMAVEKIAKRRDEARALIEGRSPFICLPLSLTFQVLSFACNDGEKTNFVTNSLKAIISLNQTTISKRLKNELSNFVPAMKMVPSLMPKKLLEEVAYQVEAALDSERLAAALKRELSTPGMRFVLTTSNMGIHFNEPGQNGSTISEIRISNSAPAEIRKNLIKLFRSSCPRLQILDLRTCLLHRKVTPHKIAHHFRHHSLVLQVLLDRGRFTISHGVIAHRI